MANSVNADQNDESLRKWKESLGIGSGTAIGDPNDPRKCIILSLGLEVSHVRCPLTETILTVRRLRVVQISSST